MLLFQFIVGLTSSHRCPAEAPPACSGKADVSQMETPLGSSLWCDCQPPFDLSELGEVQVAGDLLTG